MTDDLQRRVLEAGYGLKFPLFPLPDSVEAHIAAGDLVTATRDLRARTDFKLTLLSAKLMVDELAAARSTD